MAKNKGVRVQSGFCFSIKDYKKLGKEAQNQSPEDKVLALHVADPGFVPHHGLPMVSHALPGVTPECSARARSNPHALPRMARKQNIKLVKEFN